jgi:hypothetical protein
MSTTEQVLVLNSLEEPKSTQGLLELPCGYLDDEGNLHTELELSELTGNEEDMLASRTVPTHKKMGVLIGRCVKRIGDVTDKGKLAAIANKLTVGDRVYIMFGLRRITLGDSYPFRATCPRCNVESMFQVSMADLDIQKMPEPEKRIYDYELPSGATVRFRIMTGLDEERLAQFKKLADKLSMALLVRIELLGGKPPTMKDIKDMSMRDRDALRAYMDEVDGGVETELEMGCPNCGAEFEEQIDPGQPGFFFPSMTRRKSKTKSST